MKIIPLNQLALHFKAQVDLNQGSMFGLIEKVCFPQDSYWGVHKEEQSTVILVNLETDKLQIISFTLLGKIFVHQTDKIVCVDKSELPKTIVLKS